jgi:hypothetical protein
MGEQMETAISWLSAGRIEQYRASHQHDPNANELWSYFLCVGHFDQPCVDGYQARQGRWVADIPPSAVDSRRLRAGGLG